MTTSPDYERVIAAARDSYTAAIQSGTADPLRAAVLAAINAFLPTVEADYVAVPKKQHAALCYVAGVVRDMLPTGLQLDELRGALDAAGDW